MQMRTEDIAYLCAVRAARSEGLRQVRLSRTGNPKHLTGKAVDPEGKEVTFHVRDGRLSKWSVREPIWEVARFELTDLARERLAEPMFDIREYGPEGQALRAIEKGHATLLDVAVYLVIPSEDLRDELITLTNLGYLTVQE